MSARADRAEQVLANWWCEDQLDLLDPERVATPPPPRKPPPPPKKPPAPRKPSPYSWVCPDQMEIE